MVLLRPFSLTEKASRPTEVANPTGISPIGELFAREKLCRLMSEVYEEGMLPVKFWLLRSGVSNLMHFPSLTGRFRGIDWLRTFPCRSRICNIFKVKMDGGMLPERRFCEKFEFSRYTIWVPNVDGMGPEKEFPPVETSSKEATLPSCFGKDPLSSLARFQAPQDC
ncbi:hypothetical protein BDL97_20G011800 [Sphagnum fallax]|nr:hypothetical protein BDL97_20G011800 [Sphagnum fallax]